MEYTNTKELIEQLLAQLGDKSKFENNDDVINYEPFFTCDMNEPLTGNVEIYKEIMDFDDKESIVSQEEMLLLGGRFHHYYVDYANNLHAFSLKTNDYRVADEIIIALNEFAQELGLEDNWYVGDPREEYVYVGL